MGRQGRKNANTTPRRKRVIALAAAAMAVAAAVALSATAGTAGFSPGDLNFGAVPPGTTASLTASFTTDPGYEIDNITFGGSAAFSTSPDNTCAVGFAGCTVGVSYAPTFAGEVDSGSVTYTVCPSEEGYGVARPSQCQDFTLTLEGTSAKLPTATVTMIGCCGTTIDTVPAGTVVRDQAIVSGQIFDIVPMGEVDFRFWTNATCSGPGSPAGVGPLSNRTAGGIYEGPLTAGHYSFRAAYGGDANYEGSISDCEPLLVTPPGAATSTTTTITLNGQGVTGAPLGSVVVDHATVTGTPGGPAPTGTVSFSLYPNGSCSGPASPAGSSTLAGGSAASDGQGPLAAGSWSFRAVYAGDANYAASTSACEPLAVAKGAGTLDTDVRVRANGKAVDVATVAGVGTILPTGAVSFAFFTNGGCSGASAPAGTSSLSGGSASSKAQGPLSPGTYSFRASYAGDANYAASTGGCEPFVVS